MKIYQLTVKFDEQTEEIEYIQEELSEDYTENIDLILEIEDDYFDTEDIHYLWSTYEIGVS